MDAREEQKEKGIGRIIWKIVLVIIFVIDLCFGIKEELECRRVYKQVTTNMTEYIRNKYGFEAEPVDLPDKQSGFWSEDRRYRMMTLQYNDKVFKVYNDDTENRYWDNYQSEEITAAVEAYITEKMPEGKIVRMKYYDERCGYYCFEDAYFDGENVEQVLYGCKVVLEMVFADTEFSEEDVLWLADGNIKLTSFDTLEHRDEFLQKISNESVDSLYSYKEYQKYAPYITDYIGRVNGEITRLDIRILELDEFAYAYFPAEWRTFAKSEDKIHVETNKFNEIKPAYARCNEEKWLSKPLSKEYHFNAPYGDIWIYYPLDKLDAYELENIGIAWFSEGGMSNCRNISRAEICGEYAVFHMPYGEVYFMLVDTTGLGEYGPGE